MTMKKVYYLKTCSTCIRILKTLDLPSEYILQDIKTEEITVKQLEQMKRLAGTYEALFSKKAKLYKDMDLKNQHLEEQDFKRYILEHYTFLKRPVIISGKTIFIGNNKQVVQAANAHINEQ